MIDLKNVRNSFLEASETGVFATMRVVLSHSQSIGVRQDVSEPPAFADDTGYMITVYDKDGSGYAASSDLSREGIFKTYRKAKDWAQFNNGKSVVPFSEFDRLTPKGSYSSPVKTPWSSTSLTDKVNYLKELNIAMKDEVTVDRTASIDYIKRKSIFLTTEGTESVQEFDFIIPFLSLTSVKDGKVQRRSLDSFAIAMQGGLEIFDKVGFNNENAHRLAQEAAQLLDAPICPSGKMELLLDPGQMVLQIHESIGHPLEIDRILGDERNYAGTSFVTKEMVGTFKYGSDLLNVTFDPTVEGQFATYLFDDDGNRTQKEHLIEKGILKRALGSDISQFRSKLPGTSNSRASNWNRPPVDRMANINLEPGDSKLDEMISKVEKGVFMKTNLSWSIDDSRNKFQFGCEWGQLIENGKLTKLVRKPNYRGISRNFWNNLKMVGNKDTVEVKGVPNCGKAEPNQAIFVGHSSPVCLFSDVDVFGGE